VEAAAPATLTPALAGRPSKIVLAPGDPVVAAAQTALRQGLEALRFHETAALAGEVEAIHQFRVATRRLRALVELFSGVLHGSRVRLFRRELPWVGQTAAVTRECDVIEQLMRDRSVRLDTILRGSLAPIYEALSARRRTEHGNFAGMLASKRYQTILRRLASSPVRKIPTTVTVRGLAPSMLRPIARGTTSAGAKLKPACPPERLHRLRVRLKRLRYALEMINELGGKRIRKAAKELAALQDLLGLHNDVVVAIAWMREYAADAVAPPHALLAAGALIHSLHKRQRKLAERSLKDWKRIDRNGIIRKALVELARSARPHPQDLAPAVGAA
jgi:CHAD domain-containing protein